MPILVTGGAGFIGSHLIEHLLKQSDSPIVCLDNFNDYYDPALKRANAAIFASRPQVVVADGDFRDYELVERMFARHRFRHVVHLGAYAGVRYSVENPRIYEETNVAGTLSLLEAARRHAVERFVFVSSSTVYGRGAAVPFAEDGPLGVPLSPYGATKRAAELMSLTYNALHGVPVVCLRPFSVYGPRLRPDLALAIFTQRIARSREITLYGDGAFRRDFTHVSDICRGIAAAMTAAGATGEAINLGHCQPVEIRRLINMLEETLDKKAIINQQPPRKEDLPATCADLQKAGRLLGYRPEVPIADGIAEYVAWFKTHSNYDSP